LESLVILVVAAGLSAAVVWWAMTPSDRRGGEKSSRQVSVPEPSWVLSEDPRHDAFVMLPSSEPAQAEDRPPPALSLVRLVLTIAVVAGLAVAVLTAIGWLIKLQLDEYFRRLGS
jgi:high-affinity Fe2+/Pb2+ permease